MLFSVWKRFSFLPHLDIVLFSIIFWGFFFKTIFRGGITFSDARTREILDSVNYSMFLMKVLWYNFGYNYTDSTESVELSSAFSFVGLRNLCFSDCNFSLHFGDITAWQSWLSSFSQYPQMGLLPWSLIFLDMTSFIIHPSTAPLISSLSATHSSHFASPDPPQLIVHLSYICHVTASSVRLPSFFASHLSLHLVL